MSSLISCTPRKFPEDDSHSHHLLLPRLEVAESHVCAKSRLNTIFRHEVHETNSIDRVEVVIPSSVNALTRYGFRRIVECSICEELLLLFLHFDDDVSAFYSLALHVEDNASLVLSLDNLFVLLELDILDY